MSKPLSILVTGGAGYLGSIMVPALLEEGHRVTVLDNFMFGQAPLNQLCADPNFDVQRGDARDPDVLKPLLQNADIIIPLAAVLVLGFLEFRSTKNFLEWLVNVGWDSTVLALGAGSAARPADNNGF